MLWALIVAPKLAIMLSQGIRYVNTRVASTCIAATIKSYMILISATPSNVGPGSLTRFLGVFLSTASHFSSFCRRISISRIDCRYSSSFALSVWFNFRLTVFASYKTVSSTLRCSVSRCCRSSSGVSSLENNLWNAATGVSTPATGLPERFQASDCPGP